MGTRREHGRRKTLKNRVSRGIRRISTVTSSPHNNGAEGGEGGSPFCEFLQPFCRVAGTFTRPESDKTSKHNVSGQCLG